MKSRNGFNVLSSSLNFSTVSSGTITSYLTIGCEQSAPSSHVYRPIIVPDKEWEHSIATMIPTAYKDEDGEPIDHVTNPDKQLAHKALGDYGPLGVKVSNDDFLQ